MDDLDFELELAEFEECDGKQEAGNRGKVKARFGRRLTHNEELAVGSCGNILSRATFYGSEGQNGVRVSALASFPFPWVFLLTGCHRSSFALYSRPSVRDPRSSGMIIIARFRRC